MPLYAHCTDGQEYLLGLSIEELRCVHEKSDGVGTILLRTKRCSEDENISWINFAHVVRFEER